MKKQSKKILSMFFAFCLCISLLSVPSVACAKNVKKNVKKNVNKVIAKDKNLKVKFAYIKNGQIYINVQNLSKEDLNIIFTWTNINGTFRYADDIFYTCYKGTNVNIKVKYYSSNIDNYKYSFKKGKFQMLVTYSTDENNGKIKEKQLKTKKITVK
jgi:hypothetical protein